MSIIDIYRWTLDTLIGKITLISTKKEIKGLYFGETHNHIPLEKNKISELCEKELTEYFAGNLKNFTVPFKAEGTPFREIVWKELVKIPYGKTASYKDIAVKIGKPKAVRAVGGANHNNPISIIIPCHRIIGANGSLTGYGGGLETKKWLLNLEAETIK